MSSTRSNLRVRISVGAQDQEDRSTADVGRFLSSIQDENRGKIDKLGLDF